MKKKNLYLLLLLFGTCFWGMSFPITKLAVQGSSVALFLLYRFILATFVLSVVFRKQFKSTSSKEITAGFLLAFPLLSSIILQINGLKLIDASQCTFIAGLSVIIVPVLKRIIFKTVLPVKTWTASLIALTGLFVIAVSGDFTFNQGTLYAIAGTLAFSLYLLQVEKYTAEINIRNTIVPMFVCFALLCLLYVNFDHVKTSWIPDNKSFWLAIVFCSVFSTAYMYSVSMLSQMYLSAEKIAVIFLFEPIFGTVASFFILNENITVRLLLGGGLIFFAMMIYEVRFKKSVKASDYSEFS